MHRALAIPEILGHILGFLDDDADRMSCMFVCTLWLGVAHNLRRRVKMLKLPQRYMQSEQMSRVLAHAPTDIQWATTTVTAGNALPFVRGACCGTLSLVCRSGLSLDVVQWLVTYLGITPADIRRNGCAHFYQACESGNREIAEWLAAYSGISCMEMPRTRLLRTFRAACKKGDLAILRWLRELFHDIVTCSAKTDLFATACSIGHLKMAQWMVQGLELTAEHMRFRNNLALNLACSTGNLAIVQWLSMQLTANDVAESRAFSKACSRPHMDVVRWLASHFAVTPQGGDWYQILSKAGVDDVVWFAEQFQSFVDEMQGSMDVVVIGAAFANKDSRVSAWYVERFQVTADMVRSGGCVWHAMNFPERLKWIVERFGLTAVDLRAVGRSVLGARMPSCVWLTDHFGLTVDDARANGNIALIVACSDGDWPRVMWLCTRFGLTVDDARSADNAALRAACEHSDLQGAKWLAEHFGLTADDARARGNAALQFACANNRLETARWLVGRFGLTANDARANDNVALRTACWLGNLEIARWLVSLGLTADDARARNNDALRAACDHGHLDIVWWLVEDIGLTADDFSAGMLWYAYKNSNKNSEHIVRWVLWRFRFTAKHSGADKMLSAACSERQWSHVRWLLDSCEFSPKDASMALYRACAENNRKAIKLITQQVKLRKTHKLTALAKARDSHIGLARWLIDHFQLSAENVLTAWDRYSD